MSEQSEYKVPRPTWCPPGPWMTEPDKVVWKTAAGLTGMIVRTSSGHLCGYVAVPPGHPLHGVSYGAGDYDDSPEGVLSCHGGLTYSAKCAGHVCHVPEPGEPDDVWWFGFDCAHSGDWSWMSAAPYLQSLRTLPDPDGTRWPSSIYRDVPYVRRNVESLAEQIAAVTSWPMPGKDGGSDG